MFGGDGSEIVHLNVGGTRFTTQLATLRAHPESLLSQMFTQPISVPRDARDGCYFIDRNGAPFAAILDYLRSGVLVVPRDPVAYTLLRREVGFYTLPILSQLPQIQPALWQAAPQQYKHARIMVDEFEKVIECDEGPIPDTLYSRTVTEIVNFFAARGYKLQSEFVSRGTKGLCSIWMSKKEIFSGANVPMEIRDAPKANAPQQQYSVQRQQQAPAALRAVR